MVGACSIRIAGWWFFRNLLISSASLPIDIWLFQETISWFPGTLSWTGRVKSRIRWRSRISVSGRASSAPCRARIRSSQAFGNRVIQSHAFSVQMLHALCSRKGAKIDLISHILDFELRTKIQSAIKSLSDISQRRKSKIRRSSANIWIRCATKCSLCQIYFNRELICRSVGN